MRDAVPLRPQAWHKVHYAVKDDIFDNSKTERYIEVQTKEERLAASSALIHLEGVNLEPGAWCSKIKFRDKMKFIDTKSGAGYLRLSHHSNL